MSIKKTDLWNYLSSVPLAVTLLIILAATSIIGTLIPQNAGYEEYVGQYGEVFTKIISTLDLYDMYHSWWFVFLLALFTVNLILCSVKRLPPVLDQIRHPQTILTDELEKGLALVDTVRKKGAPDVWYQEVNSLLSAAYGTPREEQREDRRHLYFEKGRYSRLGVYITHLSIVIILIGGMIGAFFGFRGVINIPEGGIEDEIFLRGGRKPIKMEFAVRCDDFSLSHYDMGMVKEYRSDVTVVEQGREVKKATMIVNSPMSYKGLTFYQSSYGVLDRKALVRVFIKNGKDAGKSYEIALGDKFAAVPGTGDYVKVIEHYPNLERMGPAMILQVSESGNMPVNFPVYRNLPDNDMNPTSRYFFKYLEYDEHYYTGLQVTKDPGVWVVWTGCILMMIGLYYSFFVVKKRVWVRISRDNDRTVITVAGHSPRSRIFEEEFAKMLETIKEMKG